MWKKVSLFYFSFHPWHRHGICRIGVNIYDGCKYISGCMCNDVSKEKINYGDNVSEKRCPYGEEILLQ